MVKVGEFTQSGVIGICKKVGEDICQLLPGVFT